VTKDRISRRLFLYFRREMPIPPDNRCRERLVVTRRGRWETVCAPRRRSGSSAWPLNFTVLGAMAHVPAVFWAVRPTTSRRRLTKVSVFGAVRLVLQDSLAAALVIQRGREWGASAVPAQVEVTNCDLKFGVQLLCGAVRKGRLFFVKIGCETDAAVFRRRRVHQLTDRGKDCGDRLIVGSQLFLKTRLELIQFFSELSVGDQ
jgi:hypothetical protein